jgi:hypothetical protein
VTAGVDVARSMEGDEEPRAIDAPHWVRVYQEMIAEVSAMVDDHPDQSDGLQAALQEFERRLGFWEGLSRNLPT